MADFKLRAPPRLRFHGLASFDGVFGTGGAIALAGDAVARAVGQAALLRGINLAGAGVASSQATAALLKGIRLGSAAVAGATATGSLNWVVGPIVTFLQGTGGSQNLVPTGPAGYALGGVYGVDPLNTALPSLITLSEAGQLQDTGSAVTSSNAIFFTYHEPGALPTLTLHPTATGTLPYHATAYPVEGALPAGQIFTSPDDANLRGSVLSTWPDGSAQVIVVAGETAVTNGVTKTIRLRPGAPSGTALTASRIDAIVTDIVVNFGGGDQTLSSFTSPARTWWANSATICCRYVLGCGLGTMRAVIDIHAFKAGVSDRAFVEVVIENGEVDANQSTVTGPSTQTYTGATVKVNGATIATVSSPSVGQVINQSAGSRKTGTWNGGHEPFRAWYCSTWVGLDPGIEVTHDQTSLRNHPAFFLPAEESTETLSTKYGNAYDSYQPWRLCRLRMPGMSGGADDEQIALYTEEQSDYIISGDKYARRAVLATATAALGADINWRHTDGSIPTRAQMSGKTTSNANWPTGWTYNGPCWGGDNGGTVDGSHVPSVALVAFLCRPSPCFIELAQKVFCWHATNYSSPDAATHSFDQIRARGWRSRDYAFAVFLTPDSDSTRKDSLRSALMAKATEANAFLDISWNTLQILWGTTTAPDSGYSNPGDDTAPWQNHFCILAWQMIDSIKVLRGSDQTAWTAMCDKIVSYPVRYVNQATAGEWRAVLYVQYTGQRAGSTTDMGVGDFGERNRTIYGASVPAASGTWIMDATEGPVANWSAMTAISSTPQWPRAAPTGGGTSFNYDAIFWSALCSAVERDVSGAAAAWSKVVGNITNLSTWRQGFRTYPRFNRWPRNQ